MSWRLARSLITLRDQINREYPNRSKASDGTIGDAAHRSRPSDHNPNPQGVVCALDLTHDPVNGFDAHALAEILRTNRHSNLKYIISNKRIASSRDNWRWRQYSGSNPHSKHIHISVGVGADGQSRPPYDDTTPWTIKKAGSMLGESKVLGVNWIGGRGKDAIAASVWGQIACNVQGQGLWRFAIDEWKQTVPNGMPVFRAARFDKGNPIPIFSVPPNFGSAEFSIDVDGQGVIVTLTGAPSAAVFQLWCPVAKGI